MTVSLGTRPRESRQGEVRAMIISEKSFDTSIPSVMYAITRLTTSRFFSGSCAREAGGGGERVRAAAAAFCARVCGGVPGRATGCGATP